MNQTRGLDWYDDLPRSVAERKRQGDLERLIKWYFPVDEHGMALRVAWTVSGMEPLSYHRNGGMGIGLFDLTTRETGLAPEDEWRLQNPMVNVAAAHRLWLAVGWARWALPADAVVFADEKLKAVE